MFLGTFYNCATRLLSNSRSGVCGIAILFVRMQLTVVALLWLRPTYSQQRITSEHGVCASHSSIGTVVHSSVFAVPVGLSCNGAAVYASMFDVELA